MKPMEIDDFADYARQIVVEHAAPNGVFGTKMHWRQFRFFLRQMRRSGRFAGLDDAAIVREVFGDVRYVHMTREDRLAQAISEEIADQSKAWSRRSDQARTERKLRFDPVAIRDKVERARQWEDSWEGYFRRHGIEPLRVSYEKLVSDYVGTMTRAFEYLGADRTAGIPKPQLERQSDERNEKWRQRYQRIGAATLEFASARRRFKRTLKSFLFGAVKEAIRLAQAPLACSQVLASGYLSFLGALAPRLPQRVSKGVERCVRFTDWPDVALGVRKIRFGEGTARRIIARSEGPESEALFRSSVREKQEVYRFLETRFGGYRAAILVGPEPPLLAAFLAGFPGLRLLILDPCPVSRARMLENARLNGLAEARGALPGIHAGFESFVHRRVIVKPGLHGKTARTIRLWESRSEVPVIDAREIAAWAAADPLFVRVPSGPRQPMTLEALWPLFSERGADLLVEVYRPYEDALNRLPFAASSYHFFQLTPKGPQPRTALRSHRDYSEYFITKKIKS